MNVVIELHGGFKLRWRIIGPSKPPTPTCTYGYGAGVSTYRKAILNGVDVDGIARPRFPSVSLVPTQWIKRVWINGELKWEKPSTEEVLRRVNMTKQEWQASGLDPAHR